MYASNCCSRYRPEFMSAVFRYFFAGLFGCSLMLSGFARAQAADADLDAANRAYQDGHFAEAARQFEQLIATRGYSAPLCFDAGNAELKAGHLGAALLNYERARYLAPGDAGINHNLQLARKQAGLDSNSYRWWQVVLRSVNWTVWLDVILTCLFLILFALVGNTFAEVWAGATRIPVRLWRKFFRIIFFVCIPLFLFFGFVELSAVGFGDRVDGVIVAKQGTLRLSPFASSEQTGSVPEGELVTVERRHGDYLWIDEASRQSGWVQEKELAPIVPGSFGMAEQ
jgi:hypothetical protein